MSLQQIATKGVPCCGIGYGSVKKKGRRPKPTPASTEFVGSLG